MQMITKITVPCWT